MRRTVFTLLPAVALTALSVSAAASVVSIGEFTGELFEGFEGIGPPAPWDGPMPIFGGAATFDDQLTNPWIATSLTGGDITLLPFDGNLMGLAPTGWTRWSFDTPVLKFGGYFGSTVQGADGAVRFYDESGGLIDAMNFSTPSGQWTWHGWQSSVGIASIEIQSGLNPGIVTIFDNMTASVIPAPGAMVVLALGAGLARRRRR